ncbi:MAG: PilN domain-containing protein, partial [Balneolaceae bacterium]
SHLTFNNEILSPGLAVACGMAVKQLYPGLDTINMLEAACVTSNREAIEKKDAMITTAASGVVLLLTFLLLVLAGWILDNKKQQLDERLAVIEDKITAVEHARLQVHELRSSILQVRNLIDDRSSTVRHIEAVGRSLPEGVWLDELRLTAVSGTTNHFRLTIRGYALSERFISALLESLEQQKDIHGIRLVYSEQIDTQDIYKERAYQENTLVHYEIQMQAND